MAFVPSQLTVQFSCPVASTTTTTTAAKTDVFITATGAQDGPGAASGTVNASQAVDTTIFVNITVFDDLGSSFTFNVNIENGATSGGWSTGLSDPNANYTGVQVNSTNPTSSSTQNYVPQ